MFEMNQQEFESLRTHFASSNRGGSRYLPFVFTEQGVAILASVLNSSKAIEINLQIVRAFVVLRQFALANDQLTIKLHELEKQYNKQFKDVYEALNYLFAKDKLVTEQNQRKRIGYKPNP